MGARGPQRAMDKPVAAAWLLNTVWRATRGQRKRAGGTLSHSRPLSAGDRRPVCDARNAACPRDYDENGILSLLNP
jgi:hypothetical protein